MRWHNNLEWKLRRTFSILYAIFYVSYFSFFKVLYLSLSAMQETIKHHEMASKHQPNPAATSQLNHLQSKALSCVHWTRWLWAHGISCVHCTAIDTWTWILESGGIMHINAKFRPTLKSNLLFSLKLLFFDLSILWKGLWSTYWSCGNGITPILHVTYLAHTQCAQCDCQRKIQSTIKVN